MIPCCARPTVGSSCSGRLHLCHRLWHGGKLLNRRVPTAARGRPPLPAILTVGVLAILLPACSATQAAQALTHLAPGGTAISVDSVMPGTAPCDWNHGFTDPTDGEFHKFATDLEKVHPRSEE